MSTQATTSEQLAADLVRRHFGHEPWFKPDAPASENLRDVSSSAWRNVVQLESIVAMRELTAALKEAAR